MYLVVSQCILMYLNGTHRNTCKIHAGYMQDTSGYVLYRKPPPICIGNPPSPLLVYIRGKRGTSLAQMLDRCSPFPQASPINGLC